MVCDDFEQFFRRATRSPAAPAGMAPFPYQRRLAEGAALPELLTVPTGAGKTLAATLAWLYRRRCAPDPAMRAATPRRLIYCLPMRVLVEQTHRVIHDALSNLGLAGPDGVAVVRCLGGESDDNWALCPERDAIVVGTQDMLLSRALNRAYGRNRFRWPQLFGQINNDALWVFDEVQLMGSGLATSAQLDAFRRQFGTAGPCASIWMSATAAPDWLATVDHPAPAPDRVFALTPDDFAIGTLARRMNAAKTLRRADVPANWEKKPGALAGTVLSAHRPATLTLVMVNTVERAVKLREAVAAALGRPARGKDSAPPEVLLIHSRFRPYERAQFIEKIAAPPPPGGRIIISTQVLEAGVDISAQTLFTELAPWASLVQRLGRLNRAGDDSDSTAYYIDMPGNAKLSAPYDPAELAEARTKLRDLEGKTVSPAALAPLPVTAKAPLHVLRRRDMIELFDTAPDLSGYDIDVSRFIREQDSLDVQVYWRAWEGADSGAEPPRDLPAPAREELCPVPVGQMKEFLEAAARRPEAGAWYWDYLDGRWRRATQPAVRPGMQLVLASGAGGYRPDTGWAKEARDPVPVVTVDHDAAAGQEAVGDDRESGGEWQSLRDHTEAVVRELRGLIAALADRLPPGAQDDLLLAARWHDYGKAHPTFQRALLRNGSDAPAGPVPNEDVIWAKSPHAKGKRLQYDRPHFRHELAGALALLRTSGRFLSAYLAAATHGRVRLALRSLPGELDPAAHGGPPGTRYALGIWDDDELPAADLGGGVCAGPTRIDLSPMDLGAGPAGPSWTERAIRLRDESALGPFRLAYLESLLIAADWRASAERSKGAMS